MRARTSWLLLALGVFAGCFRGDFLEGTACNDDADCYPRFQCVPLAGVSQERGLVGACGDPSPQGTSSSSTSGGSDTSGDAGSGSTTVDTGSTGSTGTTTGTTTGDDSTTGGASTGDTGSTGG